MKYEDRKQEGRDLKGMQGITAKLDVSAAEGTYPVGKKTGLIRECVQMLASDLTDSNKLVPILPLSDNSLT